MRERAPKLARREPAAIAALLDAVQVANLDVLIGAYRARLDKSGSLEQVWRKLWSENRFLLSIVFGFPVAVVQPQGYVGGMGVEGKGARYVDFLLKNQATKSAAIVELKRPSTPVIATGDYAGVRNIARG